MTSPGIVILLSVILLTGCSTHSGDSSANTADKTTAIRSEEENTVTIAPVSATAQSVILLKTSMSINEKSMIYWYINDIRQEATDGLRFSSRSLQKGDTVKAAIMKDSRVYTSNKIVIKNTPPRITDAGLLPPLPKTGSSLSVDVEASDADGDNIDFIYKWTINGEYAGQRNYLETELNRGDRISVKITPFDGDDRGKSVQLSEKVRNSLPVVSGTSPSFDGKTYSYRVDATDPDGDTLTFKLEEGPEGMAVNSKTGFITWDVKQKDAGEHDIKVSVIDNQGGKIIIPFTAKIGFET